MKWDFGGLGCSFTKFMIHVMATQHLTCQQHLNCQHTLSHYRQVLERSHEDITHGGRV